MGGGQTRRLRRIHPYPVLIHTACCKMYQEGEAMHRLVRRSQLNFREFDRRFPLHPFLLTAYPIVALLGFNIDQVYAREATTSLILSLSITALALVVFWLLFRNWQFAGLLTSLLVVWFFLYGRIYGIVNGISLFGLLIGRHRYILITWSLVFISIAFWFLKRKRLYPVLTRYLNIFSVILLCLPMIQIGNFYFRNLGNSTPLVDNITDPIVSWSDGSNPPDIYYIVLDGYQRADVQENVFDIDISPFLSGLQQMGFYIADCAQSNYTRTILSISSTFNMDYIATFKPEIKPNEKTDWLLPYYKHSIVRQQLELLGYQTIVFKNPWEKMVWEDAAIVYRSSGTALLSPFEYLLLRTTMARIYLDYQQAKNWNLSDYENYEDTRYALEQLPRIPDIPGPKFVFAHLVIPHSPFVFGPDGEYINIPYDADAGNIYTEEDGRRGHTYAVNYINKRMLEILPRIIEDSKTPPIIVVAADHGSPTGGMENAVRILAAFYAPAARSQFYETITPVNLFRILFDTYFNTNLGLLPDRSYYSAQGQYFNFLEVPNNCEMEN